MFRNNHRCVVGKNYFVCKRFIYLKLRILTFEVNCVILFDLLYDRHLSTIFYNSVLTRPIPKS